MNDSPVMDWRAGWRGERRSDDLEVNEPLIVVVVSSQLFTALTKSPLDLAHRVISLLATVYWICDSPAFLMFYTAT